MDSLKSCFVIIIFTCLLFLSTSLGQGSPKSNETDRAALLEFKSRISDDPDQNLGSWNDTVNFCHWPGITCGKHHPRVTKFELPGLRLTGSLSPYIGNLSFLKILYIEENSFTGEIPPEIGRLRRLMELRLDNNSFSGQVPENISGCTKLRAITVRNNKLVGEIPRGLAALSELRFFQITNNNFTGKFPHFFGNFSSLEVIDGLYNNFYGPIPVFLGQLMKLQSINLGGNLFSGTIPASIFNKTSLEHLDFSANQLEGGLPLDLGIALPNLFFISLADNHLTGLIPPSIANSTHLEMLEIPKNNFSGSVPVLKNLNQLRELSISGNQLGSGTSGDLKFVESLNSTELQVLALHDNNFGGMLPHSIGNLSAHLNMLLIAFNRLTGTIPTSIGNLVNLETLFIDANTLTGSLPGEMGNLHQMKILQAQHNRFSGEIPSSLGNLTMLIELWLTGNQLRGTIPAGLGKCKNLIGLDLSRNYLSGTIPSQVFSTPSMMIDMDLSYNKLTGALPDEIGLLNQMEELYLQENKLSGEVPNAVGQCTSLEVLYMGNNLFDGNISTFLRPLKGLQYVDLSRNNFSGEIPKFLGNFNLTYLNLSFNHFEGEVPNQGIFLNASAISIMGNGKLCGGNSELSLSSCPTLKLKPGRKISSKVVILTTTGIAAFIFVLVLLATFIGMKRTRSRNVTLQSGLVIVGPFPQISYDDILKATQGLNQSSFIGAGSFGSVYKGILENGGKMVAIKVLDLKNRSASKSFMAECQALRNIRHRNLVKISTACSTIDFQGNEFKALVYEYMENGSLEEWLHPNVSQDRERGTLSLVCRLNVAIEIACAVEYLHYDSEMLIIHCDIKPSNVLLDAEMTAHIGDFGLAKIFSVDEVVLQASSVGFRGTFGYSPPEYGMGSKVTREGDVYSYGILLLEMFTGKRPTHDMFRDGLNIRSYCEAALPERAVQIADPFLFGVGSSVRAPGRVKECLAKVFEVGTGCCRESPGERMDIREAAAKLRSIKPLA